MDILHIRVMQLFFNLRLQGKKITEGCTPKSFTFHSQIIFRCGNEFENISFPTAV